MANTLKNLNDYNEYKRTKAANEFIEKSKAIFGDQYDYSQVNYVTNKIPVILICKKHDYAWLVRPCDNIRTRTSVKSGPTGCPICARERRSAKQLKPQDAFIKQANDLHGGEYDYREVIYNGAFKPVNIICPEHGIFHQTPSVHLSGSGCPHCRSSKLEKEINEKFPSFERQKKFDWLKYKSFMSLDFYDEKRKIGIECQGIQHFINIKMFKDCEGVKERDELKYNQCKEKGIEVIYYYPKEFDKYDVEFYKDKKCFHTIEEIEDYLK